jgi:hypothetical protein
MAVAVMPVKRASAETPSQTAPGRRAMKGMVARARSGRLRAAMVTGTAMAARPEMRMQTMAAQVPPERPIRSSQTKTRVAPGGWPAMWVGQESGWKSMMRLVKVRSIDGMSVMVGTVGRYSSGEVSWVAAPRCQPSIRASEKVQEIDRK